MSAEGFVGREAELAAVEAFLERASTAPRALLLEGAAGIGKSTVWREAVHRAETRGLRVLSCRPVETESTLSYAGLTDLVEDLPAGLFDELPAPQRQALEIALLRSEPEDLPPDPRAVATALRSLLSVLGDGQPIVVAVDDLQWLDPSSAAAVGFASRREPALMLAARRKGKRLLESLETALSDATRVELGALSLAATHELIRQRLGRALARPLLVRVHETVQGNPFYALEVAREVFETGASAGDPLPVPEDLRELLMQRVRRLSPNARDLLLVAAAVAKPTRALLAAATDCDLSATIAEVEAAGIMEVGRVGPAFTHPLYSATVYATAPREQRRRLHARLADLVGEEEERARHLALAAEFPSEDVAAELERAAVRAWTRGAPAAAAELLELAIGLTPADLAGDRRRRQLAAADDHFAAGAVNDAVRLLRPLVDESPAGNDRAEVLLRLAEATDDLAGALALVERAQQEPVSDERVLSRIHLRLGRGWPLLGMDRTLEHCAVAVRHAERAGERRLLVQALARTALWELLAGRSPARTIARGAGQERPGDRLRGYDNPRLAKALWRMYQGRLDEARDLFSGLLADAAGDEFASIAFRARLVDVAIRAGAWRQAQVEAAAVRELVEQIGTGHDGGFAFYLQALVQALLGHVDEARSTAEQGARIARRSGQDNSLVMNLGIPGLVELSLGRDADALPHVQPLLDWLAGTGLGLATHPVVPVALEALIAAGRVEEAAGLVARFEREAAELESPWAAAIAGRSRALLASAEGDLGGAQAAVESALAGHDAGRWPFEHGRTLLVAGRVHRRARQKAAARRSLEQAVAIFEALPAPLWGGRAREEIARLGARPAARMDLTETERRVAELAASGLKNREVAAQLFVSPKTVEANLARVYRKLGISSRAELGALIAPKR